MERLYRTYGDKAQFLLVYIREAHPGSTVYLSDGNREVLSKVEQTNTLAERSRGAQVCLLTLKLSMPAVVDKQDNKVNIAYAGWPDRLVVVDVDGKIAYKGGPGPGGFKPNAVEQWLRENLD